MSCGIGSICFIRLLELKGKPTSKTHFWVIDTLQTKPNFRGELSNSKVKAHRKNRARGHTFVLLSRRIWGVSQTLDHPNPMGVIPQGSSKNVVLTVSTSQLLRCYITNKMMLYITSKMMLIFLFHLICSLDLSSSCTWPSPCNWLISMNRSPY